LSIDLDVLPAAVMPAVSAPAARGVPLDAVETVLHRVLASDRAVAIEIVELNPTRDIDDHGARVAARLAYQAANIWE
jgi:formiminoglutamase